MCLSQIIKKSGIGYQVRIKNKNGTYSPCHQRQYDEYKPKRWYEAKKTIDTSRPEGFHIFLTEDDALRYKRWGVSSRKNKKVVEVKYSGVIDFGLHKTGNKRGCSWLYTYGAAVTAKKALILHEVS